MAKAKMRETMISVLQELLTEIEIIKDVKKDHDVIASVPRLGIVATTMRHSALNHVNYLVNELKDWVDIPLESLGGSTIRENIPKFMAEIMTDCEDDPCFNYTAECVSKAIDSLKPPRVRMSIAALQAAKDKHDPVYERISGRYREEQERRKFLTKRAEQEAIKRSLL